MSKICWEMEREKREKGKKKIWEGFFLGLLSFFLLLLLLFLFFFAFFFILSFFLFLINSFPQ